MPFIAIALIVAATLGGGVSVAAQNALPGDALWGFKVAVNENVQGAFAVSQKAKADWDIALVAARLAEANTLAAEDRLSAGAQADIQSNFDAHARNVAEHVARLQERGDWDVAADVAARFEAAVATKSSALVEARANAKEVLGVIIGKVQATLDVASDLSADASAKAEANAQASGSSSTSSTNGGSTNANGSADANVNANINTEGGVRIDL